jgi:predicted ferric reductase
MMWMLAALFVLLLFVHRTNAVAVTDGGFTLTYTPDLTDATMTQITLSYQCTGYVSICWAGEMGAHNNDNMDCVSGWSRHECLTLSWRPRNALCSCPTTTLFFVSHPPINALPCTPQIFAATGATPQIMNAKMQGYDAPVDGGTAPPVTFAATAAGVTTATFSLPLAGLGPLLPLNVPQMVYWGITNDGTDFGAQHTARGTLPGLINFASADAPPPQPPPASVGGTDPTGCGTPYIFCDTPGNFRMEWKYDSAATVTITLMAPVGAKGWVSVGFAAGHKSMDMVIGTVPGEGLPPVVEDQFSNAKSSGVKDPTPSELTGIVGSLANDVVTITFIRPMVPEDDADAQLASGSVPFSWAYGREKGDLTSNHGSGADRRGNGIVDWSTGVCSEMEPGFFADAGDGIIILCFMIFGVWGVIRWGFILFKCTQKESDIVVPNYDAAMTNAYWQAESAPKGPGRAPLSQKGKSNSANGFASFCGKRVLNSQVSVSTVAVLVFFILANVSAVELSNGANKSFEQQVGWLTAASSFFVMLPATRNSVLLWITGLPFDRVIHFHRWIGRFVVFLAIVHGYLEYKNVLLPVTVSAEDPKGDNSKAMSALFKTNFSCDATKEECDSDAIDNLMGVIATICGVILIISAAGYFRRNWFESFYWAHFIFFVGWYMTAFLHAKKQMAKYMFFTLMAWVLDRGVRFFWGLYVKKTTHLQYKDGRVIKVAMVKHPLAVKLGLFKVGQYVFLNFPGVSILEWHPYSVSSGPRERTIEVHIRGLGDHTNKLVDRAKTRKEMYVRVDGPYGNHKLNYRRYPVLLLVGGGVGITPVIGIIKDIYNVGDLPPEEKTRVAANSIEGIYVVWVMREELSYNWFNYELMECYNQANKDGSPYPPLYVWIYVTGVASVSNDELFVPGRPDFSAVFETITSDHQKKSCIVFACGPSPMVNECWDYSIRQKGKGLRYDFHHETFDF